MLKGRGGARPKEARASTRANPPGPLRRSTRRAIEIREDERTRIARTVHDEIGQALTALSLDLEWLRQRLGERVPAPVSAKLSAMSALLDGTLDAAQRIATELRPAVLDQLGLEAAVEWSVGEFRTRTGISCRFASELAGAAPDRETATAAFRILQEALTNVARHSGATRAEVRLKREKKRLVLEVRDDGRGIGRARVSDPRSMGIAGMRERAQAAGGEVSFRPGRRGGTIVRLEVPL
jgi:signal transduction histidine kinase